MIKLANDNLSVIINEKGAELQTIKLNDIEYLWQANENFWGKHAPVLFPIVGELKDGKYIFGGKEYKLSRHGFAREKVFEAIKTSETSAKFTLQFDDETLAIYPFKFVFIVDYKIDGNKLSCSLIVENVDTKTIYFSVGGHPAFNVPLNKNLSYSDYFLQFNNDNVLERYVLKNGLVSDEIKTINLSNNQLQLQQSLFYDDAIVLKHIASDLIELKSNKDEHGLKFTFEGFPFFGIWAAKDAPFVCLEPWCGIADNVNHNHQLTNKEGINALIANQSWQRVWSVEVF